MKNFIQAGLIVDIVLAAAVTSGEARKVGSLFGVATKDGDIGDTVGFQTEGVFDLPYGVAAAVAVGDLMYWDDAGKTVTKTATANSKVGIAVAAAAASDATARVKLVPTI